MSKHHPAAFINAIAEEGTKAEAVKYLQDTWNDLCNTQAELRELKKYIETRKRVGLFWFTADGRRHFVEGANLHRGDMHDNGRPILIAYEGEEAPK